MRRRVIISVVRGGEFEVGREGEERVEGVVLMVGGGGSGM